MNGTIDIFKMFFRRLLLITWIKNKENREYSVIVYKRTAQ